VTLDAQTSGACHALQRLAVDRAMKCEAGGVIESQQRVGLDVVGDGTGLAPALRRVEHDQGLQLEPKAPPADVNVRRYLRQIESD
jgi:hypothetical protein